MYGKQISEKGTYAGCICVNLKLDMEIMKKYRYLQTFVKWFLANILTALCKYYITAVAIIRVLVTRELKMRGRRL